MGQIAGQLLNYSRESRTPLRVAIPEIMQGTIGLFTPKIRSQGIEVQTSYRSREKLVAVPGELRQVFSNLLGNAIEASGRGGRIRIEVRDAWDWRSGARGLRGVIGDNGPGINRLTQARLFTPFFSTKGEHGTGLGLWLSRSLVEKHNGVIRFRSSTHPQRHGTVFSLFFPLASPTLQCVPRAT